MTEQQKERRPSSLPRYGTVTSTVTGWKEHPKKKKREVRTSMISAEERKRLIKILEILNEEETVQKKIDVSDRLRDEQGIPSEPIRIRNQGGITFTIN